MRTFRIILADDEPNILYGMQKGLDWERLGFSVVGTAQNGKEVLELMEEFHTDLVISDIKMPFMDGLELAKQIQENYINTKVILFSGWDDFEYARLAISYGVSEYIMKPIDYNEMQKLLMEMHEELDQEYNEKINRVRLEEAYIKSLPLLRQQFFSQLVTEPMEEAERELQIKNLKLDFFDLAYSIVAVKIQKEEEIDSFLRVLCTIGISMPGFVVATLLLHTFCGGVEGIKVFPALFDGTPQSYVLPCVALGFYPMCYLSRQTRTSMLDAINQEYIKTARAKGLKNSKIIFKHALRNALIPVITYLGPQIAFTLCGGLVVETVFSIPGLGRYFVQAIQNRDYPLIMGTTIFLAAFIIIMNLLVDICYKLVDPRINLAKGGN